MRLQCLGGTRPGLTQYQGDAESGELRVGRTVVYYLEVAAES